MPAPNGKIGHAEITIGEGVVMLADESPEMGNKSPTAVGGTRVSLMCYVTDVDKLVAKAIAVPCRGEEPAQGSVLRRSQRDPRRSVRPHLDGRHAQRRRDARRDGQTNERSNVRRKTRQIVDNVLAVVAPAKQGAQIDQRPTSSFGGAIGVAGDRESVASDQKLGSGERAVPQGTVSEPDRRFWS